MRTRPTSTRAGSQRATAVGFGFSLIELSIALALGLILIATVTSLLTAAMRHHEILQMQSRLEDNARFALLFLTRELHRAGFYGCAGVAENGKPAIGAEQPPDDKYGDVFSVQYAGLQELPPPYSIPNSDATPPVVNGVAAGTDLICDPVANANIFTHRWSVRKTTRLPSLYRLRNNNIYTSRAMVEGIEYMRVLYGVDKDDNGSVDEYLAYDNAQPPVIDFNQVRSVRIGLLVRSTSAYRSTDNKKREYGAVPLDINTYTVLNEEGVDPEDLHVLREVFTTTVQLRNVNR